MDQNRKPRPAGASDRVPVLSVIDGGLTDKREAHEPAPRVWSRVGGCSEISRAIDLLNALASVIAAIHRDAREGRTPQLQHARQVIDALLTDFSADQNALHWALAAGRNMYHLCRRAVGCAVWALTLGRQLRFSDDELRELMLGALLLDIGKLRIPVVILAKASRLNDAEHRFAQRHVGAGVRMLEALDGVSAEIIEMVRSHHERLDGSGFPCRLRGDEISLYAQIAGVIDSYDAMTVSRYYAVGQSGHEALRALQAQAGSKFAPQLVASFAAALGELPTGTWVEFPDGCLGVVGAQGDAGAEGARVALIADEQRQPFLSVRWLSLAKRTDVRVLPPAERPAQSGPMERSLQSAIYAFKPRRY